MCRRGFQSSAGFIATTKIANQNNKSVLNIKKFVTYIFIHKDASYDSKGVASHNKSIYANVFNFFARIILSTLAQLHFV